MADLYSRSGITVEGLSGTYKALKELGEPNDSLKAILREAAETMAAASRDTVPVKSGKLKASIRPAATTRGAFVYAGNNRAGLNGVPYANPIHWGWFRDRKSQRAKNSRRGYINKNIRPNPFMAKALGYTREEIFRNFTDHMERELEGIISRNMKRRQRRKGHNKNGTKRFSRQPNFR